MLRRQSIALLLALIGLGCCCGSAMAQGCVDGSCVDGGVYGGGPYMADPYGGDAYAMATAGPQPRAYGRTWGNGYGKGDWNRFYHYPYVYYPQNFWGNEYFKSADSLYYRYPAEMRIPVYNRKWHNYYPNCRPYHSGHHFILDVF